MSCHRPTDKHADTCDTSAQGRGRARQADSSFVVLSERADRPAALLAQVEQQQLAIAQRFVPASSTEGEVARRAAQTSRERGARELLMRPVSTESALATLQQYCQKTKVVLEEQFGHAGVCHLRYASTLRDVQAQGSAPGGAKKASKALAAVQLLAALQRQTLG